MKLVSLVLAYSALAACSTSNVYDILQSNNRDECATLPPSQYDECVEKANKTFGEYQKEREEAIRK